MGSSLNEMFAPKSAAWAGDASYPKPLPNETLAQYALRTASSTGFSQDQLGALLSVASDMGVNPTDPAAVVQAYQNRPTPTAEQRAAWGNQDPGGASTVRGTPITTDANMNPIIKARADARALLQAGKGGGTAPVTSGGGVNLPVERQPGDLGPYTPMPKQPLKPGGVFSTTAPPLPRTPDIPGAPPAVNSVGPSGPYVPPAQPVITHTGTRDDPIPMDKIHLDPITGQPIRPPVSKPPPPLPVTPPPPPPAPNPLAPGPGTAPSSPAIQASAAYQQPKTMYPGAVGGPIPTIDTVAPRGMPPPPGAPPPMGPLQANPPDRPGLPPIEQAGHQPSMNNGPLGLGP